MDHFYVVKILISKQRDNLKPLSFYLFFSVYNKNIQLSEILFILDLVIYGGTPKIWLDYEGELSLVTVFHPGDLAIALSQYL